MQASCIYLKLECSTAKICTLLTDECSQSNILCTFKQHCLRVCFLHIRGSAVAAINCWGETSNYKHKHLCSLSPLNHFTPVKQLNLMILWATLALWSVSFCANILKLLSTSTFKTNKRHLLKCFQKYLVEYCKAFLCIVATKYSF